MVQHMETGGKEIAPDVEIRRRRFRAALALTDTSVAAFAAQIGVTYNHLYGVLRGQRTSKRIEDAVDQYISAVLD